MRTAAATKTLISRRASYFVQKYGAAGPTMAASIHEAMQACGSTGDEQLWTRIVAAVQSRAPKPDSRPV